MRDAHAEIGAIQQAYEKGVTKGKNMVIHVQGRDVCTHCRQDIASAAEKAGLKSVTVHAVDMIRTNWELILGFKGKHQ